MYLLIPAAGMGRRMGSDRNKLFLTLLGKSLIAWTLIAANTSTKIVWLGIIGQPEDFSDFKDIIADLRSNKQLNKPIELIQGGATRQESVYNGLQALPPEAERVLIHDGARCLATPQLFDRCAEALETANSIIAAIPVKDTIKIVDSNKIISDTPDRSNLWAAQTPQGFQVNLLKECHEKGKQLRWEVTDDAALLEKCGQNVLIVAGEETNLKVTTPVDLTIAEFILHQRGITDNK
jgi:2-C-methyl-D-erythritol 4-phosphate cytidylyltransferase